MKKYLNKRGSAMVLVLCSLIILVAVSSSVVMLSAANITMSSKYSDWSSEYYKLDYAAQDQLSELDKNVLIAAENLSRFYLQNSYYMFESAGDFPSGAGMPAAMTATFNVIPDLQELIFNSWSDIYEPYAAEPVPTREAEDLYNARMKDFAAQVFDVLYYTNLSQNIVNTSREYPSFDVEASLTLENDGWFPPLSGSLSEFYTSLTDKPDLRITAKELSGDNKKRVDVLITVVPPSFSAVQQTRYFAVKANPLYSNALSVKGSVTFEGSGSVNILGDVVASNQNASGIDLGTDEGNLFGVKTRSGSSVRVDIRGNVATAGDLHLFGSGSAISVRPYPAGFSATLALKNELLYPSDGEGAGNRYHFNFAAAGGDPREFTEGFGADYIPYIYKDAAGGNVYCNNLAIENEATHASLMVGGSLWTVDDIQNDGGSYTEIEVGGNYIGMSSTANEENKDPNGSSAVINNAYLYGGTINLKGSYIIPGTSWMRFNDAEPYSYYQTAESATARAGEYFGIYVAGAGEAEEPGKVFGNYIYDGDSYAVFEKRTGSGTSEAVRKDRIDRFRAAMDSLSGLGSGITVNPGRPYYSLGVVNNNGAVIYDQYSTNMVPYTRVSGPGGILENVFAAKTRYFGTDGFSFDDLFDVSLASNDSTRGFYYYGSSSTVNVDSLSEGIIFCNGNLTLVGSGTFKGSVIVNGNLTIRGGVNVEYDEAVIRRTLGFNDDYTLATSDSGVYLGSSVARRFFSPGRYEAYSNLGIEKMTSITTSAGERSDDGVKRYIIKSWRESKAG